MILRLLKKLRTTVRTNRQPTTSGQRTARRRLAPSACLGILGGTIIAFSSQLSAQEFRQPALPGETPARSATLLQQKIQHANALKQQMMRAQIEQGASDGFAQKAFEAQQAYLAETAYEHHQGYLEMLKERGAVAPVARTAQPSPISARPAATLQSPSAYNAHSPTNSPYRLKTDAVPQTYSPPVHAAPQSVKMRLGDQTQQDSPAIHQQSQNLHASFQQPVSSFQQSVPPNVSQTYQAPRQKPKQPLYQYVNVEPTPVAAVSPQASSPQRQNADGSATRTPTLASSSPRASAYQPRASAYQPSAKRTPAVTRTQSASVSRPRTHAASPPVFPMMPKQKVHAANAPYVLGEEPPVALQDRIESLLTKPRYQAISNGSGQRRQSTMRSMASRMGVVSQRKPVQSAVHYQDSPRVAQRSRSTSPNARSDAELRHAFEMEQRIQNTMQARASDVRQVAMTAPVQDPFNDRALTSPISRFPAAQQARPKTPAKQVSILSSRQEPAETVDNQFGGRTLQSQTPSEDSTTQRNGLQAKSDEELEKIDQELNRRMKEFEAQQKQDDEDKARLQQLADDLEKESAVQADDESGMSVVDDEMPEQEFRTTPIERTCAEFRNELLNGSIRDISLDISPPASSVRDQYVAISRSWTDRNGQVIATGSMVDLRRGYVIIQDTSGMLKIPYAKLSDADWSAISDYWRLPELCSVGNQGSATRNWVPQTFTWHASSLCHKPLFFENIQLERYGHTHGPFTQPVHSVAHFFVSLVKVPYQSAITPANECQYALGFYRPGNCAPWLKDPIPFSLDGTRRQALITTGAAFIP